jgi:gliding motility-associated-like protein
MNPPNPCNIESERNYFYVKLLGEMIYLLGFLNGQTCQAQDRVEFDICGKNGVCGGVICIGPNDTTYVVTIKIKQLPKNCTATKYEVDWGDGKSETFTDLAVVERTHTYDLKAFLRDCQSSTKRFPIFVYPNCPNSDKGLNLTFNKTPVAAISTNGDVCEGQSIRLGNNSCPGSDSDITWLWDLGNGQTSTAFQPTINNVNPANSLYNFSLTATSLACGTSKASVSIPVKRRPVAKYTTQGLTIVNQDTVVCLAGGGVLTMDATISLDATRYRWTVTGGPYTFINNTNANSPKPQIKFSQSGQYTITLVVESDCGQSAPLRCSHKVVDKTTLSLPKLDLICEQPYLYRIPNPVAGATYSLNGQTFNPTTGVSLNYSATPVIAEARLQGPCGLQVDRDTFLVNAPQAVQILSRDTTICVNSQAFAIKANVAGGQWSGTNVNRQTGVYTPTTRGTFKIQYSLGSGNCASSAEFTVTVVEQTILSIPKLDLICEQPYLYKIPNPVAGATYSLNGQAFNPTTGVSLNYSATPVTVEARLQGPCGLQVDRDTFLVNAPQIAQILSRDTTVCINSPAFAIRANIAGGQWSGTNVNSQTGVFTPATKGAFKVRYAIGVGNCASSAEFTVTVEGIEATATNVESCQGTPAVKLTGTPAGGQWTTTDCNNCIRGDSLILTGVTATRLNLVYEVANTTGCRATARATVSIGQPKSVFTIQGGCSGTLPTVNNDSQGASSYRWYVNGRLEFSTRLPTFSNLPAGKHTISLVAVAGTCRDSTFSEVEITNPPTAISFDVQSGNNCSPLQATFQVNSAPRSDVTYTWDFGDGTTFTGFQPAPLTFENNARQPKTFTVQMKAENGCGTQTAVQSLTVRPLARAELGVDSTVIRCSPGKITFSNRSTGHEANRTLWYFGDGTTPVQSAKDTLIREFAAPDTIRTYRIRLVVFSECGSDTDQVFIRVIPNTIKPLFTLSQSEACPGEPIQFTDATTPKPISWVWKFGTENISTLQNPSFAFAKANTTYMVTLIADTGCGYDSIQRPVRITELPKPDFTVTVPYGCEGQEIKLTNRSNPANTFLWDFGDGTLDSTRYNPSHIYQRNGNQVITLAMFGTTKLCRAEIKKSVRIQPKVVADFAVDNGLKVCSPGPVQLRSLAQNTTRYYWEFSDGRVSNAENPLIAFRPGRYDVKFKATYEDVCTDSTEQIGVIVVDSCEVLIPEAFTPNGDGIGDLYTIFGNGIEQIEFMRIRKRTGEILFEAKGIPPGSQNPAEAWDGTFQNVIMPNDMYALEVLIQFSDGIKKNYASTIYLIR